LSDGIVAGEIVVCPLHAWRVCLDDGAVVKPADQRACVASYRTRVDAGVISIRFPAQEQPPALPHLPISRTEEPCLEIERTAG
jgi:phenylpropionate dioxygenase-like ring-hydroxylating dioxygenase large terminal subunit